MPAVRLLQSLLAAVHPAMVAADSPDMARLLESVANLLVRRSELERSYLARLEGKLHRLLWHRAQLCSCYPQERPTKKAALGCLLRLPQAVQGHSRALGTIPLVPLAKSSFSNRLRPMWRLVMGAIDRTRPVADSQPAGS